MDATPRAVDRAAAEFVARLPAEVGVMALHRGSHTIVGVEPDETVSGTGAGARAALDRLGPGLWVGWCSFELGQALEPVIPRGASAETAAVPDVLFARFGAVAWVAPDGTVEVRGDGAGRRWLERAARVHLDPRPSDRLPAARPGPSPGSWWSSLDRSDYEARVDAIIGLLRAGDCYQVNLTRRLTIERAYDPVALFATLAARHPAPYTGMLRATHAGRSFAVVCASPERFLSWRGPRVETRPVKGTHRDPVWLRASPKDTAENVMIVDLARNDLGRVCDPGSIEVPELCTVEAHPGLHHLVSTVRGRRRAGVGLGALLAATFPPASVTGAPKPRVLQVIEDLEPVRRGVYCGAFGWIDTDRDEGDLAVAIRTFSVFDDRTELGVGAGIVADSCPAAEWEETELKAARLLEAAAAARTSTRMPASTAEPVRA